jgi:hypothetical protein
MTPANNAVYTYVPPAAATMALPIGGLVSAPNAAMKTSVPMRVPIWFNGDIETMRTGPRPMTVPEEMPKSTANVTLVPSLRPGNHSAKHKIADATVVIVMTLKRPILSAMRFGIVRPMKLGRAVSHVQG